MKNSKWAAVIAVTALLLSAHASAIPKTWHLQGVMFHDGTTATGSFTYDADIGGVPGFSNVNVTTDTGSFQFARPPVFPKPDGEFFSFFDSDAVDLAGLSFVVGQLNSAMTNAGGMISIEPSFLHGGVGDSYEGQCSAANCGVFGLVRGIVSGSITTTAVPEPAPMALLCFVLASGFGLARRRKTARYIQNGLTAEPAHGRRRWLFWY